MSRNIFDAIGAEALQRMGDRYGVDGDSMREENRRLGDDWHSYHHRGHAEGVAEHAWRVALSFRCSEHDANLARVGGQSHDEGRVWTPKTDEDGCVIRVPALTDEETTVYLFSMRAIPIRNAFILDENSEADEHWHQKFDRDVVIVIAAIMATKCRHGLHGLEQPLLMPGVHPVVRAVALADFYPAALAGTKEEQKAAARAGDLLFRERHIGLQRILWSLTSRADFPQEMMDVYLWRILDFMQSVQLPFLKMNQGCLLPALGEFSREPDVLSLINRDNVSAVHRIVADTLVERRGMDFWTLLADIGYLIPEE